MKHPISTSDKMPWSSDCELLELLRKETSLNIQPKEINEKTAFILLSLKLIPQPNNPSLRDSRFI